MMTYLGKTQFDADRPLVPALGLDRALGAEIADGDFRTFVLLCQLAAQEQPGSDAPYTERGYADLAQLHPGRQRPTAETVRGRLYRLARAGLIHRQRAGRTTWRTYPHLDGARLWTAATFSPSTPVSQPHAAVCNLVTAESTPPAIPPERAPGTHPTPDAGTGRQDGPQPSSSLGASLRPTQASTEPVGARKESTQPETTGWSPSLERRVEPPTYGSLALGPAPKATAPRIVRPSADETPRQQGYACRSQGLTLQPNPVRTLSDLVPAWKPVRTAAVTEEPEHTQPDTPLTAQPEPTQPETQKAVEATPVTVVGVQSEPTQMNIDLMSAQPEHIQAEPEKAVMANGIVGAQPEHTQPPADLVGVKLEPTQTEQTTPVVTPAPVVSVQPERTQTKVDPVGVQPEHTQTQEIPPVAQAEAASVQGKAAGRGGQPSRAHTRARASVLSGTDSLSSEKSSSPKKEKTETDSTGRADAKTTPRHPVLDRVDVPAGYEGLAIQLATLQPQGMNYEGIAECLRQPELTRVWTEWTLAKGESIHNPPAFIRQRVRAGQPPAAEKPIPPHQRLVRNPNRMGWDEPARSNVRYVTYQSLYNIPSTQEVKHDPNPSRPAGDETLH